jgi:uncharacterized protein YjbJ (UPF0337 family)
MNQDQIRGVLGQLRGKAKVILGELTDNPDKKAEGSVDKLYGLLQQKFGDAKQTVKRQLDKVRLP